MKKIDEKRITATACLDKLSPIEFLPPKEISESVFRRVEIDRSLLTITELDHVNESVMVRKAIKNAFGRTPGLDEYGGE